jgi:hypothetical protein
MNKKHIYVDCNNITLGNRDDIFRYSYKADDYETELVSENSKQKQNLIIKKTNLVVKKCDIIILGKIFNFTFEEIIDMIKQTKIDELDDKIMNILGFFVIIIVESSENIKHLSCYSDTASSISIYKNNKNMISTDPDVGELIPRGCKFICGERNNRYYKNISKIYVPRVIIVEKKLIDYLKDTIDSNLIIYSAEYKILVINNDDVSAKKLICNKYCTKILKDFYTGKIINSDDLKEDDSIFMDFYPFDLLFFETKQKALDANKKKISEKYDKIINGKILFKIKPNIIYPLLNWNIFEIIRAMDIEDCNFESLCE